jgi:hypothetical protein
MVFFFKKIKINFTHVTISANLAGINSITKTKLVARGAAAMVVIVGSRGDYFFVWFLPKNITKLNFLKKKPKPNRNRFKPTGFGYFRAKTETQPIGLVFFGLARFFSGLAQLLIAVRFGLVFQFQVYETETEPNRLVFLNMLIGLIGFFSFFFLNFSI